MAAATVTTHLQSTTTITTTPSTTAPTASVATNLKTTTSTNNNDSVNVITTSTTTTTTSTTIDNTTNTITNTSSKRSAGVRYLTPAITSSESFKASSSSTLLSPLPTSNRLDVKNLNTKKILNTTKDVKEATCQSFLITDNGDDTKTIYIDNYTQTEENELEPCQGIGFQCECGETRDIGQSLENINNDNLSIIQETEKVQNKFDKENNCSENLTINSVKSSKNVSKQEKCIKRENYKEEKLSITLDNDIECKESNLQKPLIQNLSITNATSEEYTNDLTIFPKINERVNKKLRNKNRGLQNDNKLQKHNTEHFQQDNNKNLSITYNNINESENEIQKAQKIQENQCENLSITSENNKFKYNIQQNSQEKTDIDNRKLSITNEVKTKTIDQKLLKLNDIPITHPQIQENASKHLSITVTNNQELSITNENPLKTQEINDISKKHYKNVSITNEVKVETEISEQKLSTTNDIPLTNQQIKKIAKYFNEELSITNKVQQNTITNNPELSITSNIADKNQHIPEISRSDNKKCSITNKVKENTNANNQKLSITNEIPVKNPQIREISKEGNNKLSLSNKVEENTGNRSLLSIAHDIPVKSQLIKDISKKSNKKLSITNEVNENTSKNFIDFYMANDIPIKNQQIKKISKNLNNKLSITNKVHKNTDSSNLDLSITNEISAKNQQIEEISENDIEKLSLNKKEEEITNNNNLDLSITTDLTVRNPHVREISKNVDKNLSKTYEIENKDQKCLIHNDNSIKSHLIEEKYNQKLSITNKVVEIAEINNPELSITNHNQVQNKKNQGSTKDNSKTLSITKEIQKRASINKQELSPTKNISRKSNKIDNNSNEKLSITNNYVNGNENIPNVEFSKKSFKTEEDKNYRKSKKCELSQISDVSFSITLNNSRDRDVYSTEISETNNQANDSLLATRETFVTSENSHDIDNKSITLNKLPKNLTKSSKNPKKSKTKFNNMVVSQQIHAIAHKKTDNLTIIDKKLKNNIANMENKKKKLKNSLKCNEITSQDIIKANETVIKSVNEQNMLSITKKNASDVNSNKTIKSQNVLSLSDYKSSSNESCNALDTQVLQSTIDFDEDFWSCSNNENDNSAQTIDSTDNCNESVVVPNGFHNGHDSSTKCCDYCKNDSDNLSITLKIYSKTTENHKQNKNDSLAITRENSKDNLITAKKVEMELPTQMCVNSDDIPSDNLLLEMDSFNNNCECLETTTKELENLNLASTVNLATPDNCLCFSTEGAQSVLSIVENGFVIHQPNHEGIGADDGDEEIDENDLPNYSQSCVYEERIIDFENIRIIEQVIDNNCEGKHTATNNVKCRNVKDYKNTKKQQGSEYLTNDNKVIDNKKGAEGINKEIDILAQTVQIGVGRDNDNKVIVDVNDENSQKIYENPSLNFSCSELVAFIGESFQILDNAQALYKTDKNVAQDNLKKPLSRSSSISQFKNKESSSVGNSPFKRCKRATNYASGNVNSNRCVDDNNNTRRYTGITAAERLMQSLNCDVARELTQSRKDKREVKPKPKQQANNTKVVTPTKTLLKALKSKLTPLAPPFQPAAVKAQIAGPTTSSTSQSAAVLNYEQTTIYYHHQQQQQQHQQQPQQQLIMPSNSSTNNMLHALNFPPPPTTQQQQVSISQQQQQLFIPHHHPQHHLLTQQQQHQQHTLQSLNHHVQQHHQQHCAQNILAMSAAASMGQGMPHIHLPATTNNGNLSTATAVINVGSTSSPTGQQQHLLPIHLLTAVGGGGVASWPLIDNTANGHSATTPTLFMDMNGELRSICPAHGPPPPATAVNVTQPMAPITNQTAVSATNSTQQHSNSALGILQHNTVCLNPSQYPLTVTAQYHPQQQQQQQQQLHSHLHHQQHQSQQQLHNLYHSQHQPTLANSQNSPLRIKSNSNVSAASTNNAGSSMSSAATPALASATPSSSSSAVAAPPRVVLQLDAGVSLPLQIAGKRKLFRGECTFYYNSYIIQSKKLISKINFKSY